MSLLAPALIAAALLAAQPQEIQRARSRYDFGAYADCTGALRPFLARDPVLSDADAVEANRLLGICEFQLGDMTEAQRAFITLLSRDPDYVMDAFLVPPPIVEFFEAIKRRIAATLEPLRARRRELSEQARLAEEAKAKLLAAERESAGPPTKLVLVQKRIYLFNWLPLGAGQFQNGEPGKGAIVAAAEVIFGLTNLATLLAFNQIANDKSSACGFGQPGCSRPPYNDKERSLLKGLSIAKYTSAGLFWATYAYGVIDAHLNFVPVVETEIGPGGQVQGAVLSVGGSL